MVIDMQSRRQIASLTYIIDRFFRVIAAMILLLTMLLTMMMMMVMVTDLLSALVVRQHLSLHLIRISNYSLHHCEVGIATIPH
jgi:hypothetical protein